MAFATVDEYLARYPDCTATSATIAALLEDASDVIEGEISPRGYDPADVAYVAKLSRVCCSVAHRAMPSGGQGQDVGLLTGATQASQTAGSYTLSASFSGGFGEVYLTRADRIKLGVASGAYVYAEPYGGEDVSV